MIDKELFSLLGKNKKYIFIAVALQALGLIANVTVTACICKALQMLIDGAETKAFLLPLAISISAMLIRYTYSFEFESSSPNNKNERYSAKEVLAKFENVNSPEAIDLYFDKLYEIERSEMQKNDFLYAKPIGRNSDCSQRAKRFDPKKIYQGLNEGGITHFNFAGYASSFSLINECSFPLLIVNNSNHDEIFSLLENMKYSKCVRQERRKLQKYVVSLRNYERELLMSLGVISECNGIEYLSNENYYDKSIGLLFEDSADYIY